ncbi:hypothetical protein HPP92_025405 [Vanilla planifolia]|uniref:Uncharacterized protein n=1 Tax=Vanilla planifolia TaxID=51239 RepID=A0A835PHU3_VANPL|nr:hypothetical protein HPP92_025699 [Vanilla planifolia]KAG0454101.1 hypothetical protein HPP92_025405 [Vanilla planifolia]
MDGEEDDKGKVIKLPIHRPSEEASDDDDCYEIDPIDFYCKLCLGSSEDEELVLLAEKGPVALKDFPHPRYLCGNFPFGRTPDERHCDNCFCAVCEVSAPCLAWSGTGGHCGFSGNRSGGDRQYICLF